MGQLQVAMPSDAGDIPALPELPSALLLRAILFLPANEIALTARLLCRDFTNALSSRLHRTASIGQPLPKHTADGIVAALRTAGPGQAAASSAHPTDTAGASTASTAASAVAPSICNRPGSGAACEEAAGSWPLHTMPAAGATAEAGAQGCPTSATAAAAGAASRAFHQLSFRRKILALSTAAASGSETNLAVAWALLRPCLFPGVPPERYCLPNHPWGDQGAAAARAGHPHLLRWLMQHRCPLDPANTLRAVARHCPLVELQAAWQLLRWEKGTSGSADVLVTRASDKGLPYSMDLGLLTDAAQSATPDAVAKMQWVLDEVADQVVAKVGELVLLRLQSELRKNLPDVSAEEVEREVARALASVEAEVRREFVAGALGSDALDAVMVAAAAARSGCMERLEWLASMGCCMCHRKVLEAALRYGNLAMAVWVEEQQRRQEQEREPGRGQVDVVGPHDWHAWCWAAAGSGREGVAKLRWLLQHVAPQQQEPAGAAADGEQGPALSLPPWCVEVAAQYGRYAVVRFLVEEVGLPLGEDVFSAAAGSGGAGGEGPGDMAGAGAGAAATNSSSSSVVGVEAGQQEGKDECAGGSRALPLLRWLVRQGCPMDALAYGTAATAGDVAVVVWLAAEARCPWGTDTAAQVIRSWPIHGPAAGGCLAAVTALAEAGCPLALPACVAEAAERGDLGVVRYLHARHRRQLTAAAAAAAAEEVDGATADGAAADVSSSAERYDIDTWRCAATGGCHAVLEWLAAEGGGPLAATGQDAPDGGDGAPYIAAGRTADASTLGCLRRLGVPWADRVLVAAAVGDCHPEVLQWLVDAGARADGEVVQEAEQTAAALGLEQVGRWLKGLRGQQAGGEGGSSG